MKRALFTASCVKMNEPQPADKLERLVMEVRNGDPDAAAQLLLRYQKQVVSVAFDVLQDETLAGESARETLRSAVKQLQRGVRTGAFEPWLMWLARSDALRYSQVERPPEAGAKQPKAAPMIAEKTVVTPADVCAARIMNKPELESAVTPLTITQAARNRKPAYRADPAPNHISKSRVFWEFEIDNAPIRTMRGNKETAAKADAEKRTVGRKNIATSNCSRYANYETVRQGMEQKRRQKNISSGAGRSNKRRKNPALRLLSIAALLLLAAIGVLLIPCQYTVKGLSMEPTLYEGDRLYYTRFHTPGYGDLIVLQVNGPECGLVVKRVIGLAGDRITVNADGSVIRNGEPLIEPYIDLDTLGNCAMAEITVEEGKLFVLGDNRAASIDSRDARIGQIFVESVCGGVAKAIRSFE